MIIVFKVKQISDCLYRIEADRLRYFQKFDDINAALTALDVSDEWLVASESLSHF